MRHCPSCKKTTNPWQELMPNGLMVEKCGACFAPLPAVAATVADVVEDAADPAPAPAPTAPAPVPVPAPAPAPPVRPIEREPLAPAAADVDAPALVSMARARLAEVEDELARLEVLRRERAMLVAMVAAAERSTTQSAQVVSLTRGAS